LYSGYKKLRLDGEGRALFSWELIGPAVWTAGEQDDQCQRYDDS